MYPGWPSPIPFSVPVRRPGVGLRGVPIPSGRRVNKRKRGARATSRVIVLFLKKRRRGLDDMRTEAVRQWTWMAASVSCLPPSSHARSVSACRLLCNIATYVGPISASGRLQKMLSHVSTLSCRSPRRGALPRRPRPRAPPPSPRAVHGLPRPDSPSRARPPPPGPPLEE